MYMGDDPEAPNYDKEKKLIRSIFTGSRGPMLRKATGLDWAGDPLVFADGTPTDIEEFVAKGRNGFGVLHGEHSYQQMIGAAKPSSTQPPNKNAELTPSGAVGRALRGVQRRGGGLAAQPLRHLPDLQRVCAHRRRALPHPHPRVPRRLVNRNECSAALGSA